MTKSKKDATFDVSFALPELDGELREQVLDQLGEYIEGLPKIFKTIQSVESEGPLSVRSVETEGAQGSGSKLNVMANHLLVHGMAERLADVAGDANMNVFAGPERTFTVDLSTIDESLRADVKRQLQEVLTSLPERLSVIDSAESADPTVGKMGAKRKAQHLLVHGLADRLNAVADISNLGVYVSPE